jgi:hypothetical protein
MLFPIPDAPMTAWAERVNSGDVQDWIRIANRFGGGMNPVMIVGFFLLAGAAYNERRWVGYAVRMTVAGAVAGVVVQLLKFAVGRTRPELWLGPFHHARVGQLVSQRPHRRRVCSGRGADVHGRIENAARRCGTAGDRRRFVAGARLPALELGCDRIGSDRADRCRRMRVGATARSAADLAHNRRLP